jgi:hypothetical protein
MRSASTTKEDDQDITESGIVGILDSDIKLQNQENHES